MLSVVQNILQMKIQVLEKLIKIDQCFYQIVIFVEKN